VATPRPAAVGNARSLPAPVSSLIGRERDVEDVAAALSHARLLTLTGAGGVGKTRLAIEAAARSVAAFAGGVWWIELAPVGDSGVVESTLVQALDVRALPGLSELDAAIGFLAARRALVVLDNCEHVLERVARVAAALLAACPSLVILATSRAPLAIVGETRWAVAPLSLPSGRSLSGVSGSDAARLFVDRAVRVDRARRLNARNAWAVAEICRRLDGIPLALELAAARAAVLSVEAIAHGLDDALGLLASRSRIAEARHRTLRASLDWSYGLLPADARALLRRLGVFVGGATLELAREVCAGDGLERGELLAALETLVEHSLVQVDARGEVVRYRLLETVRQYALERLEESGEGARARPAPRRAAGDRRAPAQAGADAASARGVRRARRGGGEPRRGVRPRARDQPGKGAAAVPRAGVLVPRAGALPRGRRRVRPRRLGERPAARPARARGVGVDRRQRR
jgi:predicted ATPase